MTDTYDFNANANAGTYFNMLLNGKVEGVAIPEAMQEVVDKEAFNPQAISIDLKVDGVQVALGCFNDLLAVWAEGIAKEIQSDMDYFATEKAVVENAKMLLNERMGIVVEGLNTIDKTMEVMLSSVTKSPTEFD